MLVQIANADDAERLWPTIVELRPNLKQDTFRENFINQLIEGYQVAYIGDEKLAYALPGFS